MINRLFSILFILLVLGLPMIGITALALSSQKPSPANVMRAGSSLCVTSNPLCR